MKITQSGIFKKKAKKLSHQQKLQLDNAIRTIIDNTNVGEKKKGDLQDVYVYKFKIDNTLYLAAYRFSSDSLDLIMFGPHENYYRDLKNYLYS